MKITQRHWIKFTKRLKRKSKRDRSSYSRPMHSRKLKAEEVEPEVILSVVSSS